MHNPDAFQRVLDHSKAKGTARQVLAVIAGYADSPGGPAFPSLATVASQTGLHVRTVRRQLRELEELGELVIGSARGPRGTNLYRVVLGAREGISPSEPVIYLDRHFNTDSRLYVYNDRECLVNESGSAGTMPALPDPPPIEVRCQGLLDSYCFYFADQLIHRGLKQLHYRDDAYSEEWQWEMTKILFMERPLGIASLSWLYRVRDLIDHALDSDEYGWIRRPRDLREHLERIRRSLPDAEEAQPTSFMTTTYS